MLWSDYLTTVTQVLYVVQEQVDYKCQTYVKDNLESVSMTYAYPPEITDKLLILYYTSLI